MKKRFLSLFVVIAMVLAMVGPVSHVNAQEEASKPRLEGGKLFYEATDATLSSEGAAIYYGDEAWPGATNNSFVCITTGSISLNIDVPYEGYYKVFITASSYSEENARRTVKVNNIENDYYIQTTADEFCKWPAKILEGYNNGYVETGGFWFSQGSNTIDINTTQWDWGWMLIDCVALQIDGVALPEEDDAGIVKKGIDNLPEEITQENYQNVLNVKAAYDKLTEIQKLYISNVDKLNAAYEKAKMFITQDYSVINDDGYTYQVEEGALEGAAVENTIADYTGSGYVNIQGGKVMMKIDVPYTGWYKVYFADSSYNTTTDVYASVKINDDEKDYFVHAYAENHGKWTKEGLTEAVYDDSGNVIAFEPIKRNIQLQKGANTIVIESRNGEWMHFDRLILVPDTLEYPEGDEARAVFEKIQMLPETITASDKEAVQEAKTAYDKLDAGHRVAVINRPDLEKAFEAVVAADVQEYKVDNGKLVYEAEYGMHTGRSFAFDDANASAGKGINIEYGTIYLNVDVPIAGNYHISLFGSTNNSEQNKADYVYINNGETPYFTYYSKDSYGEWAECRIGTENYIDGELSPEAPQNGIYLREGSNLIVIRANWGNTNYDKLVLAPAETYISGDANEDTALNSKDIIRTKRIIAGEEGCSANFAADVDQNFVVDSIDAGEVRRILVK